jgi:hypothetical protein
MASLTKTPSERRPSDMYLFEAHYMDTMSGIDIIKPIEFNNQFFSDQRDCYLYAMGKAYDMTKPEELFSSLEFISS